jgi:hypothetical protein
LESDKAYIHYHHDFSFLLISSMAQYYENYRMVHLSYDIISFSWCYYPATYSVCVSMRRFRPFSNSQALTQIYFSFFRIFWLFGYEFWILPNLWSDETNILEAFRPAYTFEKSVSGNAYTRIGAFAVVVALGYWMKNQPVEEYEAFFTNNRQFVEDLYSGSLLTDGYAQLGGLATGAASYGSMGGGGGGMFGARYGAGAYGGKSVHVKPLEDILSEEVEEEKLKDDEQEDVQSSLDTDTLATPTEEKENGQDSVSVDEHGDLVSEE